MYKGIMTKKTLKELREEQPVRLSVFWCDICSRTINANDEPEHFHDEQCGECKKYRQTDADWGYCSSHQSVYGGRKMFEHDGCSKWIQGK